MTRKIAAFVLAALVVGALTPGAMAAASSAEKPSPDEVVKMLKEGNARFVSGELKHPNLGAARLKQAGSEDQGDHAYATVLSCSDSRVPVEYIFDAGVMDLFVIRVAGNVADTDEIGTVEYGLAHVHTPVLLVLGHTQCGAVTAVTKVVNGEELELERNIPPLVDNIIPAVKATKEAHPDADLDKLVPAAIEQNVWQVVEDLLMESPATREIVKSGKAKIVGAIYDVGTGEVKWLDDKVGEIMEAVEENPERAMNAMAE